MREKQAKGRLQALSAAAMRLQPLVESIVHENEPQIVEDGRSTSEIESWFDSDTNAPMIALVYQGASSGRSYDPVQVSVNARGIERELRKRGIDESHEDWDLAYGLTVNFINSALQTLMENLDRGLSGDGEPE